MSKGMAAMSMDEMSYAVRARQTVSGGIAFARAPHRPEKDKARAKVLELFSTTAWPQPLNILTMPGLYWDFERALLDQRNGRFVGIKRFGQFKTKVFAVERDQAIYRASLRHAPRIISPFDQAKALRFLPAHESASAALRWGKIWYHRMDVEAFIAESSNTPNAAWLDFNGPLTMLRVQRLWQFWHRPISAVPVSMLVITGMNARTDKALGEHIAASGGLDAFLGSVFTGATVEHSIRYRDTTPMFQIAFRRSAP